MPAQLTKEEIATEAQALIKEMNATKVCNMNTDIMALRFPHLECSMTTHKCAICPAAVK